MEAVMATPAAVLLWTLALLGRSADSFPPIVLLPERPPYASANVEAFVLHEPDRIVLLTSTQVFRQAQRADPNYLEAVRKLASILVHEEWHLRHGPEEAGAYEAQLKCLFQLGADPTGEVYQSVRASMAAVLQRRNRQPVTRIAAQHPAAKDTQFFISVAWSGGWAMQSTDPRATGGAGTVP
jgi:hypothetical protein